MVNRWGGNSIQWVSHAWKDNGIFIISFHALIICPFTPWSWQQFALIHTLQTWSADHTAGRTCQAFPSELPIYYDICMDLAFWCCVGSAGWWWWERARERCNKMGSCFNWGISIGYRSGSSAPLSAILCSVVCRKSLCTSASLLPELQNLNCFVQWKQNMSEGLLLIGVLLMENLQKFHSLCESFRVTQIA